MTKPLILYSTNTWLAFSIQQRYYNDEHWVCCAPYLSENDFCASKDNPPSSVPFSIYRELFESSRRGDRHSAKIAQNTAGILRGAAVKRDAGIISDSQYDEIMSVIRASQVLDFRPVLYMIPFGKVKQRAVEVDVAERAHPLSREYIIEKLPRKCFDVVKLDW